MIFLWHSTQQFQFMKYCYYYLREACLMAVKMRCYQHVSRHHIIIWRLPNWTRRQTWTISSRDIHFVVMDCKLWSEISISFELNAQNHPIIFAIFIIWDFHWEERLEPKFLYFYATIILLFRINISEDIIHSVKLIELNICCACC